MEKENLMNEAKSNIQINQFIYHPQEIENASM